MITKEEAKEKIKQLVNDFKEGEMVWNNKPEEDIKFQFIEPLFEALGWNRKDISKEQRVLKGRADYILKNGNQEVLVIEAKKTNVFLAEEEGRQAVSYAYHRKIKFAVLTNFKDIRVYHALSNIKEIDRNLLKKEGAYFKLNYSEFLDKFDLLWLLSKESFENGEINKLLSTKDEKINKPIDANILEDLLYIRELLSKELKSKKNYLEKETIDEVIQILIDRLIFIRSVEDRGLEPMNYLRSLESDVAQQRVRLQLFPYLIEKFEEFNNKYDSKLFEKGLLEKEGTFSDEILRKVILTLYFGKENNQERYLFDQIPGDLFGSIYEQYLGTILSGTEKRVKLEGGTGKRKKMGIYYTPAYIVDYIVKNTVGEYIKDKSIDEILAVKILDPACGSGSFIMRAFVEVCNVIEDKLNKGEEGSKILFKKTKEKIWKLSLGQKIEILRNCIYGVDLDEKAVELARLNLLLKLLDEESQETRKLLLPHLENNIKCGNSLIDDPKVSDRAFNWNAQFPDVFRNGGFDVVVGNPPWGQKSIKFSENEKEYLKINYPTSILGQLDIFRFFIEKAIKLISKNGFFAFVLPDIILLKNYSSTRKLILDSLRITKIDNWGMAFEDVNLDSCTIIGIKEGTKDNIVHCAIHNNREIIQNKIPQSNFNLIDGYKFNLYTNDSATNLINKLKKTGIFGDFFEPHEGIHSGNIRDKLFIGKKLDNYSKKLIFGRDEVKRYYLKWAGKYVNYNPLIVNKKKGEYAGLGRLEYFENPKIIVRRTGDYILASLDEENYYFSNNVFVCLSKEKDFIDLKYVLAILNSKLSTWFYRTIQPRKGKLFAELKINILKQVPVRLSTSKSQENKIVSLVNQMLSLQKQLHEKNLSGNEKERLEQQIKNIDYEIDQEVYNLYELTPEEQKIIEESLK